MAALTDMKCVPCRGGEPTATEAEIAGLHPQVPDWQIVERDGIKRLERQFKFMNFAEALTFTDAMGQVAEAEGHHRSILTSGAE
jgi:4a-hydroxytetrahydrobiopterin dehydratase